jgi:hypothetical protein
MGRDVSDLPGRKASSRPELQASGTLIPSGICNYPILYRILGKICLRISIIIPADPNPSIRPDLKHLAI